MFGIINLIYVNLHPRFYVNKYMKEILQNIASGYSFRTKVKDEGQGDLAVIQLKDLENNYQTLGKELTLVSSEKVPEKYLLQKGDVLFISKGANNFALVFNEDYKAVAVSAFFVLRPDQTKVIPEFLAWYINSKPAQQYLKENRAGTYIPNVNKTTLMELKVKLPPIEKQKSIAQIAELAKTEQNIYNKLKTNRNIILNTLLENAIN